MCVETQGAQHAFAVCLRRVHSSQLGHEGVNVYVSVSNVYVSVSNVYVYVSNVYVSVSNVYVSVCSTA